MSIRYYSTNRHLNNVDGITPFTGKVSFKEALLKGQAQDEGLFMPDTIPVLSLKEIQKLKGKPYRDTALLVAKAFLSDEFPLEILKKVVKDSYNYPVPLEEVKPKAYVMRLDQGPTASFKDFAARMMARLMSNCRRGEKGSISLSPHPVTRGAPWATLSRAWRALTLLFFIRQQK